MGTGVSPEPVSLQWLVLPWRVSGGRVEPLMANSGIFSLSCRRWDLAGDFTAERCILE